MPKILIKGKYIMLEDGIKENYAVLINENVIEDTGPVSYFNENLYKVYNFKDKIIMPGFINAHNHMYGVLSHGITTEAMIEDFNDFLKDYWWPCVEDRIDIDIAKLTAEWACIEMIDSGITTFADILEGPSSVPGALEAEKEVVDKSGLRGILSFEACERQSKTNGETGLKENIDFIKKYNNDTGRVKGLMSIHTLFTCSNDFIIKAKNLIKNEDAQMHMHLSESSYESSYTLKKYGKRPVEIYEELGILDEKILASQLVKVTDAEIDILAKRAVNAVSMPISNCEVGGGIAPVNKMLNAGMNVGLGTDGYINNFFEVMRAMFLIHKAYNENPDIMPAKTVYKMATSMGADALGINTGLIEKGRKADIVTMDIDTPTPINPCNIYDQIILFRNPENIKDVMVDGKWIKRNGSIKTLDRNLIKKKLRLTTEKFWNYKRS